MYVVRRAFRNYNQMVVPGSIVEPGTVKRFKSHLRDRDIIEVTEQDFDKWNSYFVDKFGVPIGPLDGVTEGEPEGEPESEPESEPLPELKPTQYVAKVVIK